MPKQINPYIVFSAINPLKDVDAFHPENVGLISQGCPRFYPCTPHGIYQLLVRKHIDIGGKHIVILGRSNIVGKPLANMMLQRGVDATVTVCHSKTKNLKDITNSADIVVAAMGIPNFITSDFIKKDSVVIDVGINRFC